MSTNKRIEKYKEVNELLKKNPNMSMSDACASLNVNYNSYRNSNWNINRLTGKIKSNVKKSKRLSHGKVVILPSETKTNVMQTGKAAMFYGSPKEIAEIVKELM